MFGIWFRIKVKFWLLAINGATWLLKSIEKWAAKSTGLIGGGMFKTDQQGKILAGMIRIGNEEITVFGPN
jgi:hypothetical protein